MNNFPLSWPKNGGVQAPSEPVPWELSLISEEAGGAFPERLVPSHHLFLKTKNVTGSIPAGFDESRQRSDVALGVGIADGGCCGFVQIGDQICHRLMRDVFFQSFGH